MKYLNYAISNNYITCSLGNSSSVSNLTILMVFLAPLLLEGSIMRIQSPDLYVSSPILSRLNTEILLLFI